MKALAILGICVVVVVGCSPKGPAPSCAGAGAGADASAGDGAGGAVSTGSAGEPSMSVGGATAGGADEAGAAAGGGNSSDSEGGATSGGAGGAGGAGGEPAVICTDPMTDAELCAGVVVDGTKITIAHPWTEGEEYCLGSKVVGYLPGDHGCATYVFTCFSGECSDYSPDSAENLASYGSDYSWQAGTWRTSYAGDLPGAAMVQCTSQGINICLAVR